MLDFYLIADEQRKPDYPEQVGLKFIAGINFKTYENLIKKGIIDSRFDYYSDFRWNRKLIEQVDGRIKDKSDSDIKKLEEILTQAMNSKTGLIAYCD